MSSSSANLSISRHISSSRPASKMFLRKLFIANEPVVDTQVVLLLAFLLERIRDVVFAVPWLLSVTVPVGSPYLM